jgi:hypothetical protein
MNIGSVYASNRETDNYPLDWDQVTRLEWRFEMKIMNVITVLVLLAVASSAFALEQEGGASFVLGIPAGDFGETVDNEGFGIEVHYGVRPQPSLTFGVGLNGMIYGSESTTYSLPLVEDFDLTTENYLAGGFLFAQWRPLRGAVQPYAEARAGINYLWTESKLEDEDWWDDDEVARETNYDDFATYWGGGGGLLIRLCEGNRDEKKPGVFLDLNVTYINGAEAEYLTEGDITIVDNKPVYEASRSETDLTTYKLGVVLTF